ncbi:hypothetical protein EV43_15305, partial [Staphylococcus aureus]
LIYPLLTVTATVLLMIYAFNPPAFWFNHLLLDGLNSFACSNIVLFGLVIGALMVIDMSGLFYIAAYVFASGAFIEGNVVLIIA